MEKKEIRFEDYEKMLWKQAHSFSRTTGIDPEELFSVASIEFVASVNSWNGSVRFSTYLYQNIRFTLINEIKRYQRPFKVRAEAAESYSYHCKQLHPGVDPENFAAFKDSLERLGEDAKMVVRIIFETPEELARLSKASLSRFLKKELGWGPSRSEKAFFEIQEALA